ncbi:acyl-CoA dehydrogenase family protein [Streptomyces sp. MZ04]|uniref:acyl-CoA dehydrogenase family protein n=1 Tax=Streptomyces sp. MZ04 TaxID=2559236 RepID=UPI00107E67DC|nr:acyl-CoA dehydrogenase family protein [Streptomyces sp. MZ04]TGB14458.1 acyl-CoA dehydrogenase [Streptomyces sp. MZ04]
MNAAPTFLTLLESGRLRWDVLRPFPEQAESDRRTGDELAAELAAFVGDRVDPEEIDRTAELPDGLLADLRDHGYFRLVNDAGLGGRGLSAYNTFRAVERVAADSVAVGQVLAIQNAVGAPALLAALPEGPLREMVASRVAAGTISAFAGTELQGANNTWPGLTATPTEDGSAYLLNGEKVFIGNGDVADLVAILATVVEGGSRRMAVCFLDADTPGFSVAARLRFMGSKGLPNAGLRCADVRVPREHVLLGDPDVPGFPPPIGAIALQSALFFNAAPAMAIARQCLAASAEFVARRSVNGRALGDYDLIQRLVSRTAADVYAMDTVVRWCLLDAGLADRWFERVVTKNLATVTAWRIADRTVSLLGGEGFETAASKRERGAAPLPVERLLRDARGPRISGNIDFLLDMQAAQRLLAHLAARPGSAADEPADTSDATGADLSPANRRHLDAAAQGIRRLHRALTTLAARHSPAEELFARQEPLRVLGRISAELFALCAVLARTEGFTDREAGSRQELADVFCTGARHRVAGLWRRLAATETQEPDHAKLSRTLLGGSDLASLTRP